MQICVTKLTIIDSDSGLSPGRRQAIIWTKAGILLIQALGTSFHEILNEILIFSFKKMHLKMSSAKWQPLCLDLNVLKYSYSKHTSLSTQQFTLLVWHAILQPILLGSDNALSLLPLIPWHKFSLGQGHGERDILIHQKIPVPDHFSGMANDILHHKQTKLVIIHFHMSDNITVVPHCKYFHTIRSNINCICARQEFKLQDVWW